MCGIFGYVGPRRAVEHCLDGLRKLEYRGYDSAGIACQGAEGIVLTKQVGKITALEKALERRIPAAGCAIAHTRWATHGVPTIENAHPHVDEQQSVAVVHNGIIENWELLRQQLLSQGVTFVSQTDSEVVAQLIAQHYDGDLVQAVQATVAQLTGAWALAVTHRDHPGQIIVTAHDSPLAIGTGEREAFIASDPQALGAAVNQVIYLHDGELAVVTADGYVVYDRIGQPIDKPGQQRATEMTEISKGGFEHYMIKEIFEQPQTIRSAMLSRIDEEYGTAVLEGLHNELPHVKRVLMLACGSAWHAGYVGTYMIEELARVPVQCEIGSEFRYKNPIVEEGTLAVAISQSGETADTLAAARELKAKGAKVVALCNAAGSTLMRMADYNLGLRAGVEISVATTKAYTAKLVVLALLALQMGRARHLSKEEGCAFLKALKALPGQVSQILDQADVIREIAERYAEFASFFHVGRRYMYPTALEAALKQKEVAYVNANGYAAGELKHGQIALITDTCPTLAFGCNKQTLEKFCSNLSEIRARRGPIIAVVPEGVNRFSQLADDLIVVPDTIDPLAAVLSTVAAQLFAYYIARSRGTEIDRPRNLAKSVTVE